MPKTLKSRLVSLFFFLFLSVILLNSNGVAEEKLIGLDLQIKNLAEKCRDELQHELDALLAVNKLTLAQLFDTFYIPIPKTNPQKYHTQYDTVTDDVFRIILDKYLAADHHILFVVAVDRNGYLPTHNSKYSRPLTSDSDYNTRHNRTKRIFNDRTGLAAARNTQPYLLQKYSRDTGEMLADLSVPIIIKGKHWGALRIGYRR
ncbi:chemotaxis protein [Desulfomarina sp.]